MIKVNLKKRFLILGFVGEAVRRYFFRFKLHDSDYAAKNLLDLEYRKCFQYSMHEFKSPHLAACLFEYLVILNQ